MHFRRVLASAWHYLSASSLFLLAGLSACEAVPEALLLEPSGGSLSGHYIVRADLAAAGLSVSDVSAVWVGGVRALLPAEDDDGWLSFRVQGAPEPGPAAVKFDTPEGRVSLGADFIYAPPHSPHFDRVVALGASLTMGVMDGVPTFEGVLKSPTLQTAAALGAYMPQPLLRPDLFPTLGLDRVGPPPECQTTDVEDFITGAIPQIMGELAYPDGSGFGYEMGRLDPLLVVRNIGVGGYQLDDVVSGPDNDELVQSVLGGFVYAPFMDFGERPEATMMEIVEGLEPTLVVSFDLLGNDLLLGHSPERITQYLPAVIDRLAATGAEVFLANCPNPDILKGSFGGGIPNEGGEELALAYNAILAAEAGRYDTVHVVPIKEASDAITSEGLAVGDSVYNLGMLGGILSFDGLHFGDTGYALLAHTFVTEINAVLGTDVAAVDIAAVADFDIHTPEAVRKTGREPADCWE
jgi:hypothetical protein